MIKLTRGELNILTVTLTEKATILNPNYLMEVYSNNDHTRKVVRFTGDTSTNPVRWNKLPMEEVELANENLEIGLIYLPEGTYDYTFFQTSATTGTSIVEQVVLETGSLSTEGTGATITTVTQENGIITFE